MKRKIAIFVLIAVLAVLICVFAACNDDDGTLTGGSDNDWQVGATNPLRAAMSEIEGQFSAGAIAYCVTVAADWTYVEIDTNPNDYDDYFNETYLQIIEKFNDALDFPDYIYREMITTSASMGSVTETIGDIEVSWDYHPDKGLSALYKYKP